MSASGSSSSGSSSSSSDEGVEQDPRSRAAAVGASVDPMAGSATTVTTTTTTNTRMADANTAPLFGTSAVAVVVGGGSGSGSSAVGTATLAGSSSSSSSTTSSAASSSVKHHGSPTGGHQRKRRRSRVGLIRHSNKLGDAEVEMETLHGGSLKAETATGSNEPFGKIRLSKAEQLDRDSIISMRNIHKTYLLGIEGVPALRGVSMSVKKGKFVCIFGTSGGGKTTLLNIIGTIDKPSKGELYLCGTRIDSKTDDRVLSHLRLTKMGFVFQTFNLLGSMTALENVMMPMVLAGRLNPSQRKGRAVSLLQSVGMGDRLDHLPSQLSGGEQQRVTIARAMANEPELLLLDEPTGDLDSKNTCIVMKLLTSLNKEHGITLVMVTHDVSLKHFSDHVIWMRDGVIQRIEDVSESDRTAAHARLDAQLAVSSVETVEETEVRQPNFYKPYDFVQRHEEELQRGVLYGDLSSSSTHHHHTRGHSSHSHSHSHHASHHTQTTTSTPEQHIVTNEPLVQNL